MSWSERIFEHFFCSHALIRSLNELLKISMEKEPQPGAPERAIYTHPASIALNLLKGFVPIIVPTCPYQSCLGLPIFLLPDLSSLSK